MTASVRLFLFSGGIDRALGLVSNHFAQNKTHPMEGVGGFLLKCNEVYGGPRHRLGVMGGCAVTIGVGRG